MDALKNAIGGNKSESSTQQSSTGGQDYGDKAAEALNTKYGGGKLSSEQLEKGTDAAREQFEKATGYDVPDKVSN
ncbi:hypothetical protein GGR56DRAFT_526582 [Xylariaceae sp. FL0804]|nr:hypothetical protein GGR56DRAFT_526582 [Xylariaceae sp. FL0804]